MVERLDPLRALRLAMERRHQPRATGPENSKSVEANVVTDPTSQRGIDVGQRWRNTRTGVEFDVVSTFRDHPTNPSFHIAEDINGISLTKPVTLVYFDGCERVQVDQVITPALQNVLDRLADDDNNKENGS